MTYDPGRLGELAPDNRILLAAMAGESLVNCLVDGERIGPRTLEALVHLLQEDGPDGPRLHRLLAALVAMGVIDDAMSGLPLETVVARLEEQA